MSQLVEKYPDKFPFKLGVVNSNSASNSEDASRRKYYISERAFSDKEIVKIVSAIQSDKSISPEATSSLVDKFLKENASEAKILELRKKLGKKQRKISKYSDRGMSYLDTLEDLADKEERVWFTIKDYDDTDFDCQHFPMVRELRKQNEHHGYIYSVLEVNNRFVAVVYLSDYKHAMITPVTNIVITDHLYLKDISDTIDYSLNNDRYSSIDEWIEKHYSGQDGRLIKFEFKFTLDFAHEKDVQYISSSFQKHWKKRMEYRIVEREAESFHINGSGNLEPIKITVQDAYVVVESTLPSFRHWYMDYKVFSNVVIINPSRMNDMLLGPLMNRLVRRISKYGSRYDYELKRTPKPEYQEFLERNVVLLDRMSVSERPVEGIPHKRKE